MGEGCRRSALVLFARTSTSILAIPKRHSTQAATLAAVAAAIPTGTAAAAT